eukprot:2380933-Rhodomonas_salina.1
MMMDHTALSHHHDSKSGLRASLEEIEPAGQLFYFCVLNPNTIAPPLRPSTLNGRACPPPPSLLALTSVARTLLAFRAAATPFLPLFLPSSLPSRSSLPVQKEIFQA